MHNFCVWMAWFKHGFPPINSSELYIGSDKQENCLTAMRFKPMTFGVLAHPTPSPTEATRSSIEFWDKECIYIVIYVS